MFVSVVGALVRCDDSVSPVLFCFRAVVANACCTVVKFVYCTCSLVLTPSPLLTVGCMRIALRYCMWLMVDSIAY